MNVINLGISGFPELKTAPVHKCIFINKILVDADIKVTVINNEALLSKRGNEKIRTLGSFEGIDYFYTTKSPYKSSSKIKKKLRKFGGRLNEFFRLIAFNRRNNIDAALFYTDGSLLRLIYYRLISKLLSFKLLIFYVEYRSDFSSRRKSRYLKLNDKLFDAHFTKFVDAVFPISEFLIEHVKNISINKPVFKVPPLIDFELFNQSQKNNDFYFLYCGSTGYAEIINFILESFERVDATKAKLFLVISGNQNQLKKLRNDIKEHPNGDNIELFSEISFDHLISLYSNAKGLLIPLRSDIRDTARFPQKIAEYVASGNPLVATNFGEVKHYFQDEINGLIAPEYDTDVFAEKLNYIIKNPERAKAIGEKGKLVGLEHFNYTNYTKTLPDFISKIIKK